MTLPQRLCHTPATRFPPTQCAGLRRAGPALLFQAGEPQAQARLGLCSFHQGQHEGVDRQLSSQSCADVGAVIRGPGRCPRVAWPHSVAHLHRRRLSRMTMPSLAQFRQALTRPATILTTTRTTATLNQTCVKGGGDGGLGACWRRYYSSHVCFSLFSPDTPFCFPFCHSTTTRTMMQST